jgi:hypothetical protein
MTNENTKLLWKYLGDENGKPVTEWEHGHLEYKILTSNEDTREYKCPKCLQSINIYGGFMTDDMCKQLTEKVGLCPIPDPYPGSEAEVAEKIRVWMLDADVSLHARYHGLLVNMWSKDYDSGNKCGLSIWLMRYCTPADKIKAFLEVVKEIDKWV